jgi:phosphoglycolate phosphatase-like HAD superfamily hydrolase
MMLKAIIFDFDGVLVESVDIKGEAFVALYENESADVREKVLAFHNDNGGMSRFDKIRHFEESFFGRGVLEEDIDLKARRFGEIVEDKVVASAWVSGAEEFLKIYYKDFPLYVASATPEEELIRIVKRRNATGYFQAILGTPVKKQDHLGGILAKNGWKPEETVMVGDAMTDYNAAEANGVPFIGRVKDPAHNPFPAGTKILPDLQGLAEELEIT